MAIIQSIRNRFGLLLAIIVGVALFAFILGDFITSGGFIIQRSKMSVAEINGTRVGYPEYQKAMADVEEVMKAQYQSNQLDESMMENIREQSWQDLIQKYLLEKEYKKIGLAVSDQEFSDLIQGQNPHPLVMQMFANPETGALNRLQLSEFLSRIDEITGAPKMIWVFYENVINKERLFNKYNTLIRKGLYVNKLEAQQRELSMATSVDFSYVQKKYTEISDSTIAVSEAEMKNYYKEHLEKYYQEETRDLKYVAFEVVPSKKDFLEAETWIKDIKAEFEEVSDVEQYINFTSPPYDPTNFKKGELPDTLDQFMFSSEIGAVYGPYFQDNSYRLAKLAKINYISDSVKASHILLPANQSNVEQVRRMADSLVTLASTGSNFGELVRNNSRDYATVMNDGDLGWFREGFKSRYFSDSCFNADEGEVILTFSEEGFHVVKIMDKSTPVKKVQVGVLAREVTPSGETDHIYYTKAVEFASANKTLAAFEEAVADNDPFAVPVYGLKPMDKGIQGIDNSRNIVHWAFQDVEAGEMMNEIDNFGGKYVVAIVTGVSHKGHAPFNAVKKEIQVELIRDKKAEILSKELEKAMAGAQSIDQVAAATKLVVNSATGVRYASFTVPNLGAEPKLIAAAVNAPEQKLSGPVAGENGVYLFTVESKIKNENQTANLSMTKSAMERGYAARANRVSFEKLMEITKIEDYRYKFY
jgi:peptidyl-prolyl cis-trans isomerase D